MMMEKEDGIPILIPEEGKRVPAQGKKGI